MGQRVVRSERPGYGGAILTNASFYNAKGQLVKSTTTGAPDTLSEYNDLGEQFRSGQDLNGDGDLDLAGPDRVSESYTGFETDTAGRSLGGLRLHPLRGRQLRHPSHQ